MFALYFAPVFFPQASPTAQLLNAAALFAVGFLMRPLGAALLLSVWLMAAGSLLIACSPGYATLGLGARLLQGLSVGGEYGTSATCLSEMAGARQRGCWSSY